MTPRPRKPRLYSLFELQGSKWIRLSEHAYRLNAAVVVFQNRLLAGFLGYEDNVKGERQLRPVKM